MIAAQRMCERDCTCLTELVSRHFSRKSEMFGFSLFELLNHLTPILGKILVLATWDYLLEIQYVEGV